MYSGSLNNNQRGKRYLKVWTTIVNGIKSFFSLFNGISTTFTLTPYRREVNTSVLGGINQTSLILNNIVSTSQLQGGLKVSYEVTYEAYEAPYLEVDKPEIQWVTIWNPVDYNIYSNTDWFVE